jgi:hypothetical protein
MIRPNDDLFQMTEIGSIAERLANHFPELGFILFFFFPDK